MKSTFKDFIEDYKQFLWNGKTERECVADIAARLRAAGFSPLSSRDRLGPGDRFYRMTKGKTVVAGVVGRNPAKLRIVGSHVDAPKLDLKPAPLFESGRLALAKLHDYGWIKPYQWVDHPLELHGLAFAKDGRMVEFRLGEKEGEPLFVIPDIPPHIASGQMKQPMEEGFNVSQLNALLSGLPAAGGDGVLAELRLLLAKDYGLEDGDFACADLCLVPHARPVDVGFGGALVGGYGQDDRSSVYASLAALLEIAEPESTALCFFVDKEEVASTGDTSAQGPALRNFAVEYCELLRSGGLRVPAPDLVLEASEAISADVTTAFDPNFPDKFDSTNIAYLGGGVAVEKYGAAGAGKFRANEARAEYMQTLRSILEGASVKWQTGTLARLGVGGGGTIAAFIARLGADCVDAGVCLLGMHSPFEIAAKSDVFECYKFYRAFLS
jgi:Aspartyl aminopeptidase